MPESYDHQSSSTSKENSRGDILVGVDRGMYMLGLNATRATSSPWSGLGRHRRGHRTAATSSLQPPGHPSAHPRMSCIDHDRLREIPCLDHDAHGGSVSDHKQHRNSILCAENLSLLRCMYILRYKAQLLMNLSLCQVNEIQGSKVSSWLCSGLFRSLNLP